MVLGIVELVRRLGLAVLVVRQVYEKVDDGGERSKI
jgi:hypothetical protein